jgi:CxxC motif-containing protein
MNKKELICIGCPMGCNLEIQLEDDIVKKVSGNSCKIGETYAIKECTNPMRIVTTSVAVIDGDCEMVSVKTEKDIPKNKIWDCIKALKDLKVSSPVKIGDIIVENVANTGVNIIATRKVDKK